MDQKNSDDTSFFIIVIVILIILLFIVWFFWGGQHHEFEGINFLNPPKGDQKSGDEESFYEDVSSDSDKQRNQENESEDICEFIPSKDQSDRRKEEVCLNEYLPSIKVNLPSLELKYYENFTLNKKGMAHQETRTAAESRGEKLCRSILESYYSKPFPTCRPDFLMNPETGKNLELDCYNEELGIALEYNGIQHYVFPNKFHKTQEEFDAQRSRDKYKKEQCERSGIYLISVPYEVPHGRIPSFIEYNLIENVLYRQEHGIEGTYEDDFWDEKEPNIGNNGYI